MLVPEYQSVSGIRIEQRFCVFDPSISKMRDVISGRVFEHIPKKEQDARDPLQNRCITLMCCVSKLDSSILNRRLQKFLENNNILAEEQNGFRASRSCIDHILVLCSVLRNRKALGLSTFLSYIDFQKAFDSVDRNYFLSCHKYSSLANSTKQFQQCTQTQGLKSY
jgi:hypothetical protein